jgi:hypothetical protein
MQGALGLLAELALALAQRSTLLDQRDPGGGLIGLGQLADLLHRVGVLVLLAPEPVGFGDQFTTASIELAQLSDVGFAALAGRKHADVAVTQISSDALGLLAEQLDVEHGSPSKPSRTGLSSAAGIRRSARPAARVRA